MIVHRLLWPRLQRQFQDPLTPAWFQARVQARTTASLPKGSYWRVSYPMAMFLMPSLYAAKLIVLAVAPKHYQPWLAVAGIELVLVWGVLLAGMMVLHAEVRMLLLLYRFGRARTALVEEEVRGELTGHERLDYRRYVGDGA